ncbi:DUF4212 domain-containing protein [Paraferrimonas sp. SM1919]|uniref:DUF4212 domain-containing protein n=1 Tax=Paraferrimonas sp. SM1919 TaxID=2662263 RepID=UPI0013D7B6B8|nr:DUF4212 domain-containing protein [Paraferrimonas sp. SM1919]
MSSQSNQYWRANVRLVLSLLAVWAFVSFGLSIILVDELNHITFFGFKLGFWFAQQGSMYVFVLLIAVYVYQVNKLDKKYGLGEDE